MLISGHASASEIDGQNIGQTFLRNPRLVYRDLGKGQFQRFFRRNGPGIHGALFSPQPRSRAFGRLLRNDGDLDPRSILRMNDLPSFLLLNEWCGNKSKGSGAN